jgi:hypothetical protein
MVPVPRRSLRRLVFRFRGRYERAAAALLAVPPQRNLEIGRP